MEKHIQTALSTIMIGLVVWVGVTLSSAQQTMASLEARMESMDKNYASIKLDIQGLRANMYPMRQATSDLTDIRARLRALESRTK